MVLVGRSAIGKLLLARKVNHRLRKGARHEALFSMYSAPASPGNLAYGFAHCVRLRASEKVYSPFPESLPQDPHVSEGVGALFVRSYLCLFGNAKRATQYPELLPQ